MSEENKPVKQDLSACPTGMCPFSQFKLRPFISWVVTLLFLVMLYSGIMLYFAPRGRVAHWTNWTLCGLDKEQWIALHINISVVFVIAAAVHLFLNWKTFWSYIRNRATQQFHRLPEMLLALLVTLIVFSGSLNGTPPFANIMAWNTAVKDYWETQQADAPMPHAEELPLGQFAQSIGISPPEMMAALKAAGYEPKPGMTVKELAETKGVAPSRVLEDIQKTIPDAGMKEQPGMGQGMGAGPKQSEGNPAAE